MLPPPLLRPIAVSAIWALDAMGNAWLDIATFSSAAAWSYQVAPALVLGLLLGGAVTAATLMARLAKIMRRMPSATRRYRPGRDDEAVAEASDAAMLAHLGAFVEVESTSGEAAARFFLPRDMVRIGREDDNDIRFPSDAVHRYHAAIHREDFDGWHITDLSGFNGNGVKVNGRICQDAVLHDGDLIELGPGRLRFHAAFA